VNAKFYFHGPALDTGPTYRKGWRCCDPTTEKCHISRNVVFDEIFAWWSPEKVELLNSKGLEEVPEEILEDEEEAQTPSKNK